MQTRATSRLSKKLTSYARRHSWRDTAKKYNILSKTGKPSKGMAKLIAEGYEPKKAETRARCGLPEKISLPHPVTINQLMKLPISEMPPEILKLAFEHREEMQ
jgi:hypothetical protein